MKEALSTVFLFTCRTVQGGKILLLNSYINIRCIKQKKLKRESIDPLVWVLVFKNVILHISYLYPCILDLKFTMSHSWDT